MAGLALKFGSRMAPAAPAVHLQRAVAPPAGWQIQFAPSLLGARDASTWSASLEALSGTGVAAATGESTPAVWNLTSVTGQPTLSKASAGGSDLSADPLYPSDPLASFAWAGGGWTFEGELYRSEQNPRLLIGPLRATAPSGATRPPGQGFGESELARWPADTARLVVLDPALLSLPEAQRSKLLKDWSRWEFDLESDLRDLLGSSAAYGRWRDQPIFALSVKDPGVAAGAIEARFPESVVRGAVVRHQGSRIRAFGSDGSGPAWFLRGSTLWASKSGGAERMKGLLEAILQTPRPAAAIFDELLRLAQGHPGWRVAVLENDNRAPLRWGALLRWEEGQDQPDGCIVVSLDPPTDREARP